MSSRTGSSRAESSQVPTNVSQRGGCCSAAPLQILVIAGGIVLARRSIRQGRSDRRGATRFAVVYFGLGTAFELLRLSGNPESWFELFHE